MTHRRVLVCGPVVGKLCFRSPEQSSVIFSKCWILLIVLFEAGLSPLKTQETHCLTTNYKYAWNQYRIVCGGKKTEKRARRRCNVHLHSSLLFIFDFFSFHLWTFFISNMLVKILSHPCHSKYFCSEAEYVSLPFWEAWSIQFFANTHTYYTHRILHRIQRFKCDMWGLNEHVQVSSLFFFSTLQTSRKCCVVSGTALYLQ